MNPSSIPNLIQNVYFAGSPVQHVHMYSVVQWTCILWSSEHVVIWHVNIHWALYIKLLTTTHTLWWINCSSLDVYIRLVLIFALVLHGEAVVQCTCTYIYRMWVPVCTCMFTGCLLLMSGTSNRYWFHIYLVQPLLVSYLFSDDMYIYFQSTVRRETLAPGKFDEFGEWLRIPQISIHQIFLLLKWHVPVECAFNNSPDFIPPKTNW